MRIPVAVASLAALLAACSSPVEEPAPPPATTTPAAPSGWRDIASSEDASRLGRLDQAWRMARAEAEVHGFATEVEALGPLVDPYAGQAERLAPPPGAWRCRLIRLGSNAPGGTSYRADPFATCTVEPAPGGGLVLSRTAGPERMRGRLHPDTDRRLVYIGARAEGPEQTGWPVYGQTLEGDQIGVFERIGSERWRLVLPWPGQESKLEILELVR